MKRRLQNGLYCLAIAASLLGILAVITLASYIGYHRVRFYLFWDQFMP